jgi:hypothetical protein
MQDQHFAIVIGLSSYPNLGDPPANLHGPENDADDVASWLRAPDGGGLPEANVMVIRSRDAKSPPEAAPTREALENAFIWLDDLAKKNAEQTGRRKVGSRLYLYASGHGFSPRTNQGCLLAGNAAQERFNANVFPSGWLEWFQDAEYFSEYVLWMDCCMDRQIFTTPAPPPVAPITGGGAPVANFIALAAPRPLRALEKPIPADGGRWHGIFTWNLLEGLRGAAATTVGDNVTSDSLAAWLRQAQLGWLDDGDRKSPDLAKEPVIPTTDPLVFARNVAPKRFDVELTFPATAEGQQVRVWTGQPPRQLEPLTVSQGRAHAKLAAGLYVVDVAGAKLRQGFAVTRTTQLAIHAEGPPVEPVDGLIALDVDPKDPTAVIRICTNAFQSVDGRAGSLTSKLPCGVYQIRIRIGRQFVEDVLLLDRPWPASPEESSRLPALPAITTPAPLPSTRATHEYHEALVRSPQLDFDLGVGGELLIMARCYGPAASQAITEPWQGVSVLDANGKVIVELEQATRRAGGASQEPAAALRIALAPGAYLVRYPLRRGGSIAQSVVIPPGGWRMEVYLLWADPMQPRPSLSVLMRKQGAPWGTPADIELEKARTALADEQPILSDALEAVLLQKFDNPLAGIVGGHLLLIEQKVKGKQDISALNTVVGHLRDLVGAAHPDVEALSLACPDTTLRTRGPIGAPPMFARSWKLLIRGSQNDADLVPIELWRTVHALVEAPPFLVWSVNAELQKDYRHALAQAAFMHPMSAPAAAAVASRNMSIEMPASAHAESVLSNRRAYELGLTPGAVQALRTEYDARE